MVACGWWLVACGWWFVAGVVAVDASVRGTVHGFVCCCECLNAFKRSIGLKSFASCGVSVVFSPEMESYFSNPIHSH